MITCSMKKKRRGKEDEKRKKRFHFFLSPSENRTWILEFAYYTLAINKNKKHNQLYLDEESQHIFCYYA